MGFKRPFNEDEIHELTCEQTTAPSYDITYHFMGTFPLSNPLKHIPAEGEGNCRTSVNSAKYKTLETDGLGTEMNNRSSLPLEEIETSRRVATPRNDSYACYFSKAPRKVVAVGTSYQATIPSRDDELSQSTACVSDSQQNRYLGSCVIQMPKPNSNGDAIGMGRKRCNCSDIDSVRCVRQHIMEAREKLRVSVGHQNFVGLGFYEIGEEVACHWSQEEESDFNRLVYSNPASLGLNFWRHLAAVFPSKSKKDTVSYYFNVFMLRKRASQNRSNFMGIDSDDDEFHGVIRNSGNAMGEEESPRNPRLDSVIVIDSSDDSDGDEANNDADVVSDETGKDSWIDSGLDLYELKVCERNSAKEVVIEEDSCMSCELSSEMKGASALPNEPHHKLVPTLFLFDACDSKLWDAHCARTVKDVDFLPTSNIMDEFFGKDNFNLPDQEIN